MAFPALFTCTQSEVSKTNVRHRNGALSLANIHSILVCFVLSLSSWCPGNLLLCLWFPLWLLWASLGWHGLETTDVFFELTGILTCSFYKVCHYSCPSLSDDNKNLVVFIKVGQLSHCFWGIFYCILIYAVRPQAVLWVSEIRHNTRLKICMFATSYRQSWNAYY